MEDVPSSETAARHILVADDDEDVRDTLAAMIRHLGHRVQVEVDGASALQAVLKASVPPRLVLLDIAMPRLDGLTVAAHLAALPSRPRVVLVTGGAVDCTRVRDLDGVDDVLLKPWSFADLQRVLAA